MSQGSPLCKMSIVQSWDGQGAYHLKNRGKEFQCKVWHWSEQETESRTVWLEHSKEGGRRRQGPEQEVNNFQGKEDEGRTLRKQLK